MAGRGTRRWLWAALLLVGLAAAAALLLRLSRSVPVTGPFASALGEFVVGDLVVDRARASLPELRVDARDVRWFPDGREAPAVGGVDRFDVEIDPLALLRGDIVPRRLSVEAPRLVARLGADGVLHPLDRLRPRPLGVVPTAEIRDGRFTLSFDEAVRRRLAPDVKLPESFDLEVSRFASYPVPPPARDTVGFAGHIAWAPLGGIEVEGGFGPRDGFHFEGRLPEVDLSSEDLLGLLGPRLRARLRRYVGGGILSLRAILEGFGFEGGVPRVRGTFELRDGRLPEALLGAELPGIEGRGRFDARSLVLEEGKVPLPGAAGGEARVTGRVAFAGDAVAGGFHARVDRVEARWALERLHRTPIGAVVDPYSPLGTVSGRVDLDLEGGRVSDYRVEIVPLRASASYVGEEDGAGAFPYRLVDLSGRVIVESDRVLIEGIEGTHRGGGRARVDGSVSTRGDGRLDLRIGARALPLDEGVLDSLSGLLPELRSFLAWCRPAGTGDVDLGITRLEDEPVRVGGRVRCEGLEIRDPQGGLAAHDARLELALDGGRSVVERFEARMLGATLTAHGELRTEGDGTAIDLAGRLQGLDLGSRACRDALASWGARGERAAAAAERLASLGLAGTVDVDFEIHAPPGGEAEIQAFVTPRGVEAWPSFLPIPLRGVLGRLVVAGLLQRDGSARLVEARALEVNGRFGDGIVRANGTFDADGVRDLWLGGRHVPLDSALVATLLDRLGVSGEGWEDLDVGGRADVDWRRLDRTDPGRVEGSVDGLAVEGGFVPGAGLARVFGGFVVDLREGRLAAEGVEGEAVGLGPFRASEVRAQRTPSGVSMSARDLRGEVRLGPSLSPWLPLDLRAFLEPRGLVGRAVLRADALEGELVEDGGGFRRGRYRIAGSIVVGEATFSHPVVVDSFSGRATFEGGGDFEREGSGAFHGVIQDLSVGVRDVSVSGLAADWTLAGSKLVIRALRGSFAGGRLSLGKDPLEVIAGEHGAVKGSLKLEGADVRRLLREVGGADRDISGRVDLSFTFAAPVDHPEELTVEGRAAITEGELTDLPLFAAIYRYSLGPILGEENRPLFRTGGADFRIENGLLFVDRLELRAPVRPTPFTVTIRGGGVIGPSGVDLRLVPQLIGVHVPILSPAIDLLKRALLNYRVYGPIQSPRVTYWNAAADVVSSPQDVLGLPRLAPRREPVWPRRF